MSLLYFTPPSSEAIRAAIRAGDLGMMTSPDQGSGLIPGARTGFDNGCYGTGYPGDAKFLRWLEVRGRYGAVREFAVCPDVPYDAAATMTRLHALGPAIRDLGYPVALAAQNGLEDMEVPWEAFDVLFIAGDTEWKLGPAAADLASQARDRGMPVHMGRVNGLKRLRRAAQIGCTSADGTYMCYGPTINLQRMSRWLAQVNAQPTLWDPAPRTSRPRLLDLYCGAGGAGVGYYRAGFDVTGVDNRPQPDYPFTFVQADALTVLRTWDLSQFDAIHASPPCQAYTALSTLPTYRPGHPDLIAETRELLQASGLPWVIENVPGAPLRPDVLLCGTMFGLTSGIYELRRHRIFETSGWSVLTPPCRHRERLPDGTRRRTLGVYGHAGSAIKRHNRYGDKATAEEAAELMGIDWMASREISEAIPPRYTEHLGTALIAQVVADAA